ncbi:hypothetical protein TanjilG_14889 [Lupinus angustifolius]|uniref:WAT1-related protein n=1 Tax=Lupinus angustifolius TaxID=3871 RepID=A0A1J7H351_LUPAN|nr:hypothetical protein TanjilG_14889 [Lupinus angustifolius]
MMDLVKAIIVMVLVQVVNGSMNIMTKLVLNGGMNLMIMVAYRYIIGYKKLLYVCTIFSNVMAYLHYAEAIALTSVTFVTCVTNLVSGITFVLSLIFKLEKVKLREAGGRAKVIGTLIGISGAMVLTLFKGMEIKITSFHANLFHHKNKKDSNNATSHTAMYIFNVFSSFAANITYVS